MSKNPKQSLGFWKSAIREIRLSWRLLWDYRVPLWNKLIPFATLLYIIFPFDFVNDLLPVLGQLDDLGVLILGIETFNRLVADPIVRQHLQVMGFDVEPLQEEQDNQVIEGEYKIVEEEDKR
jgi:uncharacterized membrane protein YkvA (DUF1232 family)